KGPDATAGSNFNLYKTVGIKNPSVGAKMTVIHNANPTTKATKTGELTPNVNPNISVTRNANIPITSPEIVPDKISLMPLEIGFESLLVKEIKVTASV